MLVFNLRGAGDGWRGAEKWVKASLCRFVVASLSGTLGLPLTGGKEARGMTRTPGTRSIARTTEASWRARKMGGSRPPQ